MSVIGQFIDNNETNTNHEDLSPDITILPLEQEPYLLGIDSALENISTLLSVKKILDSTDSLSLESIKLINCIYSTVDKNVGSNIERLSMESMDTKDAISDGIKKLVDTIIAIWKNIVKTVEHILSKIMDFIKQYKSSKVSEKIDGSLKANGENIKNADKTKRSEYIEDDKFLNPLKYMNKELVDTDILDNIDKLAITGKQLRELVDDIETTYIDMDMFTRDAATHGLDSLVDRYKEIVNVNKIIFYNSIINFIDKLPKDFNEDDYDIIHDVTELDINTITNSHNGVLRGFIYGGSLYFIKNKDPDDIELYSVAATKIEISDQDKLRLKYAAVNNLEDMQLRLIKLANSGILITNEYSKSYEVIRDKHLYMIKLFNKCIENSKGSQDTDKVKEGFDIVKLLIKSLLKLTVETSKGYGMFQDSLNYYVDYLVASTNHYNNKDK